MKNILFLYIFLASLASLKAQQAREPQEVSKLNKHQELTSARLSDAQLQAYTKRAQQKLVDMLDYVQLSIESQDTQEQKQALKQLQNLFWEVPNWAKTLPALREYVGKTRNFNLTKSTVINDLAYQNTQAYKGSLAYTWAGRQDTLNFIVRKNKKQIGTKNVEVWEVFLSL